MKKALLFLILSGIYIFDLKAQWCTPTSLIPYDANMPGITHVVLNTIDRTSADLEHYPNNSYVNTGLSTVLTPGQTYSISITFTIDAQICPDMNIRVWIDYNHDFQLDDAGETVVSADNHLPGTLNASFTVPSNVTLGTTRMRVTAKMTPAGGHTLPTPCDNPADPLGYHGEIEDYDIVLSSPTGIENPNDVASLRTFASNDQIHFVLTTQQSASADLKLFDVQGKLVSDIFSKQNLNPGTYQFDINTSDEKINPGIYIAVLMIDNKKQIARIAIP